MIDTFSFPNFETATDSSSTTRSRRRTRARKRKTKTRDHSSNSVSTTAYESHPTTHVHLTSPTIYHPPLDHCLDKISYSSEGYQFHDASNCVAMDCEMVGVGPLGQLSVLARVSIVDWHGTVILDTFVKVHERVVDYRTHVSGIREDDLVGDQALEFGVVRTLVQNVLKGKVLVGHGLTNDLTVFHLKHPWHMIRDSATYQPLMRFNLQPRRLKELASVELGRSIQRDGIEHDSIEDARAAMEIYKRHQAGWDYDIRSMMTSVQMPTSSNSYWQ